MTWRPRRPDDPVPPRLVGDSLDRLTRGLGGPSSGTVAALFSRWDDLVGGHIAAHAQPLSLMKGILVVAVDDPAWAVELRYLEQDLLGKIRGALGEAEVVRIQVKVHRR